MIRAFQWDLARQVERLDWLLAQLPRYADWGYQELYLHLEDAVEYPSFHDIARTDAYSLKQLETLTNEALKLGIKVVPIVNLLGHTQYLIKTQGLRELNELTDAEGHPLERGQICPLHPRTLEVAETLIRDLSPLCTAGKVHVGLDESFLLGRHPLSRAEIQNLGLAGHFAKYVGQLHQLTTRLGLGMGMWADMLALIPEAIPLLPAGISAYDWFYYPFKQNPRMELFNFAEYNLAPALRAQGIDYWCCPMNGAFRFEPMPVFGDRLSNLRSWWLRAQREKAEGFLVTSWESYRLAQEMTTLVDAAAASFWKNPGLDDHAGLLAKGFERVFGPAHSHDWARSALACDERAFAGYAKWEINERWDIRAPREGYGKAGQEERFFRRLARRKLPEAFAASVAFRLYLARREVFVRRAQKEILGLRRKLAAISKSSRARTSWKEIDGAQQSLTRMRAEAGHFALDLKEGKAAAKRMWKLSRDPSQKGQNLSILEADTKKLKTWQGWLGKLTRSPKRVWEPSPVCGAWFLQFTVHNFAPALQRVVVEEKQSDGTWRELHGRYTIEFRAQAARAHSRVKREFALPISPEKALSQEAVLRLAVRGLGQVAFSHVELGNGVVAQHPLGWSMRKRRILGATAPQGGFPVIDMSVNRGAQELQFALA